MATTQDLSDLLAPLHDLLPTPLDGSTTPSSPAPTSTLYDFPPDLGAWRARLFAVDTSDGPLTLSAQEWAQYWPYVDNVWSRKERLGDREYFRCRRWRKEQNMKKPVVASKRRKMTRDAIACGMSIRAAHQKNGEMILTRSAHCTEQHHDSLAEADRVKIPKIFLDLASQQVSLGYAVADVAKQLRGVDNPELRDELKAAGGKWLTRQHVHNAGSAFLKTNPDKRRAGADASWKMQREEALQWLLSQRNETLKEKDVPLWEAANIEASHIRDNVVEKSSGFVFAQVKRLKILCRRGAFVLMDSTHNTNRLEWKFFYFNGAYRRGSLGAVAHMLVPEENGDIVAKGLRQASFLIILNIF